MSQTRTGLGDAGRGSSLSEQLLQKISPQFLQWCCRKRQSKTNLNASGLILHPLRSTILLSISWGL